MREYLWVTQLTQRTGLEMETLNLFLSFSIKVHWRVFGM